MQREMPKGSPEYNAFMAAWNFWKNFGTPEDNAKYWENVLSYENDCTNNPKIADAKDLVSQLCVAIANVLDARMKSIKKFGDEKHGFDMLMESYEKRNREWANDKK